MRKFLFLALLPLLAWGDAHLFVYHRFGDSRYPSTNTSLDVLRAEFEHLKSHGYKVVPLSTLAKALREKTPVDPKWVVLTIDDAYASFYEKGLPLFREYGYPFTLFVPVKAVDRNYRDYMDWDQLRNTLKYGEIGLHSYDHPHLVSMTPEALRADTRKALASFEKELGFRPAYYAYPYGEYNPRVRREIDAFGFELILNQNSGAVDGHSDPRDLDRTALTGENTLAGKLKIETLPTAWIAPKSWPADGELKTIHATIPENVTDLEYYVSGYGWQRVKAHSGELKVEVNLTLKLPRTRIFLKEGLRQSSIILVKE
jgi:peptidoglycan/xylan/chitin deacetylase (PgdA/CDA1 family)